MINTLIFSRDRPCQLHLLLESIELFCPNLFDITVLYKCTDPIFEQGYEQLRSYFNVRHIEQSNFQEDVIRLVSGKHVAFAVDDDVVYKLLPCDPYLPKYSSEVFSCRLGLNTVLQTESTNQYQPPLNRYSQHGNIIEWNVSDYHPLFDYGYPMSVDMHIFHISTLAPILPIIKFNNPTELESRLFDHRQMISFMLSYKESVVVNIPCNNMTNMTPTSNTYGVDFLNFQYLSGKKIDLASVVDHNVVGTHQNIPFGFVNLNG